MLVEDRVYSVQLRFADPPLAVSLTMIPIDTELGRKAPSERLEKLIGSAVFFAPPLASSPTHDDVRSGSIRHVRELLALLVHRALTNGLTGDQGRVIQDIYDGGSTHFASLPPYHQEVVDYVLSAPLLPVEQSWPVLRNLGAAALAVGGLSLAGIGLADDSAVPINAGAVMISSGTLVLSMKANQALEPPLLRPAGAPPDPELAPRAVRTLAETAAEIEALPLLDDKQRKQLVFEMARRQIVGGPVENPPSPSSAQTT